MVNLRMGCVHAIRGVDFDNVKAAAQGRRVLGKVHSRRCAESFLLFPVYILPCRGKIRGFAELDLHKHQICTIGSNQVDLPIPAAIAGSQNVISLFSQVLRRQRFPPGPQQITFPDRISSGSFCGEWGRDRMYAGPRSGPWCHSPCGYQSRIPGTAAPVPA